MSRGSGGVLLGADGSGSDAVEEVPAQGIGSGEHGPGAQGGHEVVVQGIQNGGIQSGGHRHGQEHAVDEAALGQAEGDIGQPAGDPDPGQLPGDEADGFHGQGGVVGTSNKLPILRKLQVSASNI